MDHLLQPVLEQFRTLCAIPHPSGHEEAVTDHLLDTLTALGLAPERDEALNVRCLLPATPGRGSSPGVILQAHTDMVCVSRAGMRWDPKKDPVQPVEREGWLCSDGATTLGADNGIAVAVMLWLAQHRAEFAHGPVTLLFTACEEQGLVGARALDPRWLEGCGYYINLDAFRGDAVIFAAAGGLRQKWGRDILRQPARGSHAFSLALSGLTGGHSGFDIHRGRANAISLLLELLEAGGWQVSQLSGGSQFNAIPTQAEAVVVTDDPEGLKAMCRDWLADTRRQWAPTDPALTLAVEPCPLPRQVWDEGILSSLVAFFRSLPQGAVAMRQDLPDTVADSGNPAVVGTEADAVTLCHFGRCASQLSLDRMERDTDEAAKQNGFRLLERYRYPAWEGAAENSLTALLPGLERLALHVGLEGAIFAEKCPALAGIALGFDIEDAHAVTERVRLASIPVTLRRLMGLLEQLSKEESL